VLLGAHGRAPGLPRAARVPPVLGVNIALIAACGSLALLRQCRELALVHRLPLRRGASLVAAWFAASLFVGAQASWYMRPFCGVASVDAPFMLGSAPDFRGATSFYEAVYQLVDPPSSPQPE
jgi:hypothetical protein